MKRARMLPWFLILLSILCSASLSLASDDRTPSFGLLADLASLGAVPGFPPSLFQPANEPSRHEIAYFLFLFDREVEKAAEARRTDPAGALALLWLRANPQADPSAAGRWAENVIQGYHRLLLDYCRELGALGYLRREDSGRGPGDVNAVGH